MSRREASSIRASLGPLALASLALASVGCAQNALLELYIEVPPPILVTDGPMRMATHVRLAVVADEADPSTDISGSDSAVIPLRAGLTPTDEAWLGVTLVRGVAPETNPTTVRIIYCPSATECDRDSRVGFQDIVIDRAFYTGRRTCYAHFLTDEDYADGLALPTAQDHVTSCAIGGCTDADFMESPNFCDTGGSHFCLESNSGTYCDTLRARIGDGLIEP